MAELEGKVALVTGAAGKRGMGHAVAVQLAKEGADVAVLDKHEAPPSLYQGDEGWRGLPEVVEEVQASGREALALIADVSDSNQVDEAVDATLARFGKINILVNCAGIAGERNTPVVELKNDAWQALMDTNLTGSFYTSRAVAKDMILRRDGGKIVHISSMLGKSGRAGMAAYSASKHGIIGLVRCLALELAPYKINVNAICPGWIITNMRDEFFKEQAQALGITVDEARDKRYKKQSASIPLGYAGTAKDISDLVSFLVSSGSDYLTGQAFNVTGGYITS